MNSEIKAGDIVIHVHPHFRGIKLYVVKKLENGNFKCRFKSGEFFSSDDFDVYELKQIPEKGTSNNIRALGL